MGRLDGPANIRHSVGSLGCPVCVCERKNVKCVFVCVCVCVCVCCIGFRA